MLRWGTGRKQFHRRNISSEGASPVSILALRQLGCASIRQDRFDASGVRGPHKLTDAHVTLQLQGGLVSCAATGHEPEGGGPGSSSDQLDATRPE